MLPIQPLPPHSPTRNARVITEPPKLQKRQRMFAPQFDAMPPLDLMAPVAQNPAPVVPAAELDELANQTARLRINH